MKTGYEWNKYNQTHYDFENPPPKVIQGYKFNIFYPDLIDKSKTPEYTLEMADNPQFCIIKFKAGPPYEVCFMKNIDIYIQYLITNFIYCRINLIFFIGHSV